MDKILTWYTDKKIRDRVGVGVEVGRKVQMTRPERRDGGCMEHARTIIQRMQNVKLSHNKP